MKSWAHTYMAGSLLGTVLIVAALVAFVPLVSLTAPDEWPTPGLGLVGGAAKSDVGVSAGVVAAAKHPTEAGGLSPNLAGGPSAPAVSAIAAVPASGGEPDVGRPGGAEAGGPANGTVAVSPAPIEVARNPGSATSEGAAAVPLPNLPETVNAPAPTATEGEVGDVGKPGETPSTPPINAGAGTEGPESLPPERPESVPPPPSGGSTEGGDVPDCPEVGDEGEAAPVGDGNAPAGSSLDPEPDAGEVGAGMGDVIGLGF